MDGAKIKNPRIVLGSSLGEVVRFKDKIFFFNIKRCVLNDQAYDKSSGNEV
jgi:hypothetical protein